jgi:hypothetical protein
MVHMGDMVQRGLRVCELRGRTVIEVYLQERGGEALWLPAVLQELQMLPQVDQKWHPADLPRHHLKNDR